MFDNYLNILDDIYYSNNHEKINLSIDSKHFNYDDLTIYDNSGNMLISYLIQIMSNLININDNQSVKIIIINLLVDVINYTHTEYNKEYHITNIEIKKFKYVINGETYVQEDLKSVMTADSDIDIMDKNETLNEEELIEKEEIKQDDREEIDALDLDGDVTTFGDNTIEEGND